MIRIAGVINDSIVDGRGLRYSVFTQGCPHACPGCHNPQTHSFSGGVLRSVEELFVEFKSNPLLTGITFSGGEPFCQPAPLAELAGLVHSVGKDVTVYTGYTLEKLTAMDDHLVNTLLRETNILIDGPFVEAEKDLSLRFRGSRNQRVIDMNLTRTARHIVFAEGF